MSIFPAPLLLLAAVAERTRTLGLGIAIVLLPLSHPVRVAEEIAALDAISNGRVEFGIGRGSIPTHFAGFGIDQSESRERMMEALDLIRRAWTSERVSFEGQFYSVEDISDAQHGTVCGCRILATRRGRHRTQRTKGVLAGAASQPA